MTRPLLALVPDNYGPAVALAPGLLRPDPIEGARFDLVAPETAAEDCRNALQLLQAVEMWATSHALLPRDGEYLDALDDAQRRIELAVEKLERGPGIGRRLLAYFLGL